MVGGALGLHGGSGARVDGDGALEVVRLLRSSRGEEDGAQHECREPLGLVRHQVDEDDSEKKMILQHLQGTADE